MEYTDDFKDLYTKLLYNFISIKINEEAFNNKMLSIDKSLHKQIITNPFELDDNWVMKFIVNNIGIEINSDNKKETFETLISELFCLNSTHIFENTCQMFGKIISKIYYYDPLVFKKYLEEYFQKYPKENKSSFKNNNIKNNKLNSYQIINLLGVIIDNELIKNKPNIKIETCYNLNPIEFFHEMKTYRNSIVHSNSVINISKNNKKNNFYKLKKINDNEVLLRLDFNLMKNILDVYEQTIYVIYMALNIKYQKEDELKLF